MVFTPLRNGEGMLAYFADKSRAPGNHLTLQLNRRILNCNQAVCEWNKAGDRAVVTVSNDVDHVGAARGCDPDGRVVLRAQLPVLPVQRLQAAGGPAAEHSARRRREARGRAKEASVQESQFSPDGSRLCAITASIPAASTLFALGRAATKVLREGLQGGRLLREAEREHAALVAARPTAAAGSGRRGGSERQGFGNLNGDICIWDDADRKRIVQFKTDYITSCAWAPNSRYLILGTCYPRMKVDNRLYVYKFNGKKVYQEDFDLLYGVSVRPVPAGLLPIRPPTVDDMAEMRSAVAKKAPSKYVPPHLRAKQAAAPPKKKSEPK